MIGSFPLTRKERKNIEDKATEICKELHKIFPYCVISCFLREDLLYQFDFDFSYFNVREDVHVYIDRKVILTSLPELLAKFIYDRYIVTRMIRVRENINK